ncbi:MAG: YraN family protein [Candidatus Riflebacteria bacterium]|nr:YraN family protein [Candidatus Riflebacteria bacterium]
MADISKTALGIYGEKLALEHLLSLGYKLVCANYRIDDFTSGKKIGEIDLVMTDADDIVFVEVRTKKNDLNGTPLDTITSRKRRQMERCARYYIENNSIENRYCRFDVVGITMTDNSSAPILNHVKNAFICGG